MKTNEAEATAKAQLSKLMPLFADIVRLHEQMGEMIDDLRRQLAGRGIDQDVRVFRDHWNDVWQKKYRGNYAWRITEDVPQIKRLVRLLTLDELMVRAGRYLEDGEGFFRTNRHPFSLFVRDVNKFATMELFDEGDAGDTPEAPHDCKHAPACRTELACTRRRSEERRVS